MRMLRIFVFIFLLFVTDVHSLYCHKCMTVDCAQEDPNCERITSFIHSEVKDLYHFDENPVACPPSNEVDPSGYGWRVMQLEDTYPCPDYNTRQSSCALGRMQIKTFQNDTSTNVTSISYNHATVLGCTKQELRQRIYEAFKTRHLCDYLKKNETFSDGTTIQLELEHCRDLTMECSGMDYCINWKYGKVKPWRDYVNNKTRSRAFFIWRLVFLAIATALLFFIVYKGVQYCMRRAREAKASRCNFELECTE